MELRSGFEKAVGNGFSLVSAAISLLDQFPQVALGLAQLGQEEIGKSLSILAAVGLRDDDEAWRWFWSSWRDHTVKAHRAFLYEMFNPLRIELIGADGVRLSGQPLRRSLPGEKEAAFYLNFDALQGTFVLPDDDVKNDEIMNRAMTASYLAQKAFSVSQALGAEDSPFRYTALSELAFRVCTEKLYQQDMPAIFEEFRNRSNRHAALVKALEAQFEKEQDFWTGMIPASPREGSASTG